MEKVKEQVFGKLPKLHKEDKVLLLTHTDMDGAGPAILLAAILDEANLEVRHCPNNTMDNDILSVFTSKEYLNYDLVMVSDISCSLESAEIINQIPDIRNHLILLDHHKSAIELNKFEWAKVIPKAISDSNLLRWFPLEVDTSRARSSGTALVFDYLEYLDLFEYDKSRFYLSQLAHEIAIYDTWDWMDLLKGEQTTCKQLSTLCVTYGVEYFIKRFNEKVKSGNPELLDEVDKIFLEVSEKKIAEYISRIEKNIKEATLEIDGQSYDVVYTFDSNYLAEVAAYMREKYPNKDLYIIDFGKGVSLRSVKPEVDVAEIAKKFGGGGHPGASGFSRSADVLKANLESIFNGKITDNQSKQVETGFFS